MDRHTPFCLPDSTATLPSERPLFPLHVCIGSTRCSRQISLKCTESFAFNIPLSAFLFQYRYVLAEEDVKKVRSGFKRKVFFSAQPPTSFERACMPCPDFWQLTWRRKRVFDDLPAHNSNIFRTKRTLTTSISFCVSQPACMRWFCYFIWSQSLSLKRKIQNGGALQLNSIVTRVKSILDFHLSPPYDLDHEHLPKIFVVFPEWSICEVNMKKAVSTEDATMPRASCAESIVWMWCMQMENKERTHDKCHKTSTFHPRHQNELTKQRKSTQNFRLFDDW